jgi:hypothetical protein
LAGGDVPSDESGDACRRKQLDAVSELTRRCGGAGPGTRASSKSRSSASRRERRSVPVEEERTTGTARLVRDQVFFANTP